MTDDELVQEILTCAGQVLGVVVNGDSDLESRFDYTNLDRLVLLVKEYDRRKLTTLTEQQIWWLHEVFEAGMEFALTKDR